MFNKTIISILLAALICTGVVMAQPVEETVITNAVVEEIVVAPNGKETTISKKKSHKQVPPNVTAQIFWEKNRKPNEWNDRFDHDVKHKGQVKVVFLKGDEKC